MRGGVLVLASDVPLMQYGVMPNAMASACAWLLTIMHLDIPVERTGSDEALASADILSMKMKTKVMGIAHNGIGLIADYPIDTQEEKVQKASEKIAQAVVVLVLLSQGSLDCEL